MPWLPWRRPLATLYYALPRPPPHHTSPNRRFERIVDKLKPCSTSKIVEHAVYVDLAAISSLNRMRFQNEIESNKLHFYLITL